MVPSLLFLIYGSLPHQITEGLLVQYDTTLVCIPAPGTVASTINSQLKLSSLIMISTGAINSSNHEFLKVNSYVVQDI